MKWGKSGVLRLTLAAMVMSVIAISCNSKEETLPHIRYGQETCDRCRMIISEKRFAAAYQTDENVMRKFDDLGCAVIYSTEHGEPIKHFWIYDYEETAWLDTAAQVFFVQSANLLTPMGYGIVAVKTKGEAQRLAENTKGQIVEEFNQLQHILSRNQ